MTVSEMFTWSVIVCAVGGTVGARIIKTEPWHGALGRLAKIAGNILLIMIGTIVLVLVFSIVVWLSPAVV
jgi:putative Mn2+ efflux pump MntP